MKNLYFSSLSSIFTFSIIFLSIAASSQVTIDQNNFPRGIGFTDTLSISMQLSIAEPTVGPNQSWDYSPLTEQSVSTTSFIDASSDINFPNAKNYFEANLTFQGFFIGSNTYEGLDASGWYNIGRSTIDTIYSISSITGGATDSLRFNGSNELYNGRINFVKFPMTYQSMWTESYEEEFDFEITVLGFGLNKTPGNRIRVRTDVREVVGHGNLKIPMKGGSASDDIESLLLKVNRTVVDSYFLAGSPAPASVLGAFGLVQGSVTSDSFFVFYTPDYGSPVLNLDYSSGGTIESAVWRPAAAEKTTGIQVVEDNKVVVYPNPVRSGEFINIEFQDQLQSLQIIDISGKLILNVQGPFAKPYQLKIPGNLDAGSYLIQLHDEVDNVVVQELVVY